MATYDSLSARMVEAVGELVTVGPETPVNYLDPLISACIDRRVSAVVSLNYDNVFDLAAESAGLKTNIGFDIGGWTPNRGYDFGGPGLPYVRLHGSANWWEFRAARGRDSGLVYS
jgi:hypothetical protein